VAAVACYPSRESRHWLFPRFALVLHVPIGQQGPGVKGAKSPISGREPQEWRAARLVFRVDLVAMASATQHPPKGLKNA